MRINRGTDIKALKEVLEKARQTFWEYLKSIEWIYDDKALKLEKEIDIAEYNLYCAEYEDNRRRNWN